ncbi:MAG: hypothetical protein IKN59_01895 [Paludibacteraceae bacterium]|nr:hypothetical protein [Paludibacteraceae bacterium]
MSLQRITCSEASGDAFVHVCDPCGRELGRVRGAVLFDGSYDVAALIAKLKLGTAEGNQQAVALFEAAIADGKAHLISETTGTYDGGAPQTGDGYGDEETRLLGYLYTLNFKDPSYKDNKDFWEKAENEHWIVAWRTETLLHFADKPAGIQAIAPVEQDLTSAVAWNITATWKSKAKPEIAPLEALAKYFEGCWSNSDSES